MKRLKKGTIQKLITDGRIEVTWTVGSRYLEIRWARTGKSETIEIV